MSIDWEEIENYLKHGFENEPEEYLKRLGLTPRQAKFLVDEYESRGIGMIGATKRKSDAVDELLDDLKSGRIASKRLIASELIKIAEELIATDADTYKYDPEHKNKPDGGNWHKTEEGWSSVQETHKKVNEQSTDGNKHTKAWSWLNHHKTKGSDTYKVTLALLKGEKNPDKKLNIEPDRYDRILRSIDNITESDHEMKWRTNNYSTHEAEVWAVEKLKKLFDLKNRS